MLFPDGPDQLPQLRSREDQSIVFNALAQGYQYDGQPSRAVPLFRRANLIDSKFDGNYSATLGNLSEALYLLGSLRDSAAAARGALLIDRKQGDHVGEAVTLQYLGTTLAAQGIKKESLLALCRSVRMLEESPDPEYISFAHSSLAQRAIWLNDSTGALGFADRAWELAINKRNEREFISSARLQGEAALGLNNLVTADERLHHALTRARMVNLSEDELPALVALAELRRRQGELGAARELLGDVWEAAERGPYPLFHADACCVLAEVERDGGNVEKAVEAARKAYGLAWCDGPPFAYHWGLERARRLLKELGAEEPLMPAFDESKFEPMPEVEIDPADEFGAGSGEGE
jgi:tetratricopeptide (TPR) repeat protein